MKFSLVLITTLLLLFSPPIVAQENTSITCADGIDNDGDGLIDCLDNDCANLSSNGGCTICSDGISFADVVLEYVSGCSLSDPDPSGALGVSDWTGVQVDEPQFVFLGQGGFIKLGFTNNALTNSGDAQDDLWVFEVGPAVESSDLALRPADVFTESQLQLLGIPDVNSDGYYEVGNISGSTSGLDIDFVLPGYLAGELIFDAVEIRDVVDGNCSGGTPGADIDAVCALSSTIVDCQGAPNGTAAIDDCGVCLELSDPAFNQSCIDCLGNPNGNAVVDDCGVCLSPDDPAFNQSCADCSGTPNGNAVVDDCGVCLSPDDPAFNQSCMDCLGILNGTAEVDACGECLDINDPAFNQSCIDCSGTANGNAIIDDCGTCNDPSGDEFNQLCIDCAGILFGDAVIDSCGVCLQPTDPNFNESCIKDIYIPNSFSPNYDGNNDVFALYKRTRTSATINTYKIFSRWGELLYEANNFEFNDQTNWWNGEFRNQEMGDGVYLYYVEVLFQDGTVLSYKGDVQLLR